MMTLAKLIMAVALVALSGCMVTPLQPVTAPAPASPAAAQPAPPVLPAGSAKGFSYTVTDPNGKQVTVHHDAGAGQKRLAVAVRPDGTALLTSTAASTGQSIADLAAALQRMAPPDAAADDDTSYLFAPGGCEECRDQWRRQGQQDSDAFGNDIDNQLDPVRDGK